MATATELLETLRSWDVPYVFCCPGTSETPLLDALALPGNRDQDPTFMLTTHEAISVSMADGYARASGGLGVAYLHTNVGLANGIAHLYAAQVARSSVALLTGIKGTATLPHRALTTSSRILETAAPYVCHAWQNLHPDDLVVDVDRTLWRATVRPEQPTILTIPQNHITDTRSGRTSPGVRAVIRQSPADNSIEHAVHALAAARRPLIIAGSDVARRNAQRELERIAERLGAPVQVESRRDLERWSFRSDHPHYAGLFDPRSALATQADLIVIVGAPTPLEFSSEMPILPPETPLVHITEDPAEAGRRVVPVGALVGDTAESLRALADALPERRVDTAWLDRAVAIHAEQLAAWRASVPASGSGDDLSAATAMRVFAETLGGHGTLVLDSVTSTLPLLRFVQRTCDDSLFATSSGSLGWGMGAAAGVALARKDRVIAVVGDGVVQFGVPAFWTVARYRIPVTYVVVNNGLYQAVISGLKRMNGAAHTSGYYPLTDISGVDIARLAASFGISTERISSSAELAAAIAREKERDVTSGPHLIDIHVNDTLWQ